MIRGGHAHPRSANGSRSISKLRIQLPNSSDRRCLVSARSGFFGVYPVNPSLSSAELHDPATGVWTTTGTMNTSRGFHTATLLANGQVVAAGGSSGSGRTFTVIASAELYTP